MVSLNDVKRFELRTVMRGGQAAEQVRAFNGHTMAAVCSQGGLLLTLTEEDPTVVVAAAEVSSGGEAMTNEVASSISAVHFAVHGTQPEALDGESGILAKGLNRMTRNHISLCKEFGEEGESGEIPRNSSVFIWVDIHRAIREGGARVPTGLGAVPKRLSPPAPAPPPLAAPPHPLPARRTLPWDTLLPCSQR